MCLISVLPKGTEKKGKIVEGFINKGITTNTHGSGIMWKKNGTSEVNIKKGLKCFDDVMEAIENSKMGIDDEVIVHHRIGTCGEQTALNTHPFLISEDISIMENIKGNFKLPAMAHNGIFSAYTDRSSKYNDTFHFVNKFIALPGIVILLKERPEEFEKLFRDKISGQRLAFLFPDRDYVVLGNFIKDDGYLHSNAGYKNYVIDRGGSSFNNSSHKSNSVYGDNEMTYEELWEQRMLEKERLSRVNIPMASKTVVRQLELPKGTTPAETNKSKQIILTKEDVMVTENNYKHFMFLLKDSIAASSLKENTVYALEGYEEDEQQCYVYEYPKGKDLIIVNANKFLGRTTYHVKSEYEKLYRGLHSLVVHTDRKPSKSILKKIEKTLNNHWNKETIKFKTYGVFTKQELMYFYKSYNRIFNENLEREKSKIKQLSAEEIEAVNAKLI